MFYDKLSALPEPGSLREVVCILVQRYRQEQQFNALVASMAATPEGKRSALDTYMKSLAPYIASTKKAETDRAKAIMEKFMQDGPMTIVGEE